MRLRELYTGYKSFSYIMFSPKDQTQTEILLDTLDANGYRYWLNSKLNPDKKDIDDILTHLNKAAVTIFVLTENSVNDPFLGDLLVNSLSLKKPIVVYIPENDPADRSCLNYILERNKTVVVFRAVEQDFRFTNVMKEVLKDTKGIAEKESARIYNAGLEGLRNANATPESINESMKRIMLAADYEYAPALCFLGELSLDRARRCAEPYSTAVAYFKAAVKLGNVDAIYNLGCLIADGEGFSQNYGIAQGYISMSAMQGNTDAQYRFAVMLDNGQGVRKNRNEAYKWYKKALDGGDRRAYLPLAYRYLAGDTVARNETIAAKYFTEAAEDGNIEAVIMLAKLYKDGVGVRKDMAKAESYFRRAAEENISEAQYQYAMILQSKKNYGEAFKWLKLAASERESGEEVKPEVLYEIAQCYITGRGTPVDRATAFMYYHRAALLGHVNAKAAVSDCYKKGIGVPVNKRAADFYNPRRVQKFV